MKDLEYKPFTAAEVADICKGIKTLTLDSLMADFLPIRRDREGRLGLDYMGLFAVHCSVRWTQEGAGPVRSGAVLMFVMKMALSALEHNLNSGNTFPVPRELMGEYGLEVPSDIIGVMIPAPEGRIGNTLNLKRLKGELDARLTWIYPKGWQNR